MKAVRLFRSTGGVVRASRPRVLTMATGKKAELGPTRNLHWVFKVGNRTATCKFYQEALGMTPLRHEEFEEGCAAACNGPYAGKWSKTMIGYGPEDVQFVLELTYNYGVKSYQLGNDYRHIAIHSKAAFQSASKHESSKPATLPGTSAAVVSVAAPGGFTFLVVDEDVAAGVTSMTELSLSVSDLSKSLAGGQCGVTCTLLLVGQMWIRRFDTPAYWQGFLGFSVVSHSEAEAVLSCGPGQAVLRLVQLPVGTPLDRGTAFGRVAFATPGHVLKQLEADVLAAGYTVHTPYVSLDTPGKATVQVVILQDPDGHEICFVGDEGFRDLSQVDPAAAQLLQDAITQDKSEEWFKTQAIREAIMQAKGV